VNSLKIDRSFITHLENDRDKVIVRTAIDFGHHLDLEVVAEGIETAEVLETLKAMRCDMAQGWYIGRPMPAEQLQQLVIEERRIAV
ncbi:MAG: EAL domain-containing protein, partial [Pseudomonadota bacterium]|nr:EAL domain-containing protein [Pseudomonadota bacterium]